MLFYGKTKSDQIISFREGKSCYNNNNENANLRRPVARLPLWRLNGPIGQMEFDGVVDPNSVSG
jgi:hypothetical protein